MSYDNLDHIIKTWTADTAAGQFPVALTPDRYTLRFERRISPFQHRTHISERLAWVRWIHHQICWPAFLIMINALVLLPLTRSWVRRLVCYVAPIALAALILGALSDRISQVIWRGDHAYLSDYGYVPVQQWPNAGQEAVIVAWPVRVEVGRSWGAYSDGTVRLLEEEYVKALAAGEQSEIGRLSP